MSEPSAERQKVFEAWMAYEAAVTEHDGWPATSEVTDAASELVATLPAFFTATDPPPPPPPTPTPENPA